MTVIREVEYPPGCYVAYVAHDLADATSDWQECAAYRCVKVDDNTVEIQIALTLEAITAPEKS